MYHRAYEGRVAYYHGLDREKVHNPDICEIQNNMAYIKKNKLDQKNIIDIDDMLTELNMETTIEKPLWATIRTRPENREKLEQALTILEKNGIRVERSYEK